MEIGERSVLTLGSQISSAYPAMCGIQRESEKKIQIYTAIAQQTYGQVKTLQNGLVEYSLKVVVTYYTTKWSFISLSMETSSMVMFYN